MQYFKNRQPNGIPTELLENAFKAFLGNVPEEWLNKQNYHPLRVLWKRNDVLSSNEIYTLGSALAEVKNIDPLWLRHQVKLMKSAEKNNYSGAITEILSISFLNNENHPVKPTKANQAGYDALMSLVNTEKVIRYSIKNYGQSKHEETFIKWASKTEELIQKLLKKHKYYPVTIWIDCPSKYPTKDKWELLHSKLDEVFKLQKDAVEPFTAICTDIPEWVIIISPNIATNGVFHPQFHSYTFVLSSVYHQNENENLLSKIHDACVNLTKHSATEDDAIKNFLLIHLSPLASIENCKRWLDGYFEEYPEKPITGVLFYQPSVVSDLSANASFVNHFFYPYIRPHKIDGWLPANFNFNFSVPVGRVSTEPALYSLNFTHPNGETETITVNDRYMYQRGNHYLKMQPDDNGGYSGNITQFAPGVFCNIVLELPEQPEKAVIAGRFPPSDELLIL